MASSSRWPGQKQKRQRFLGRIVHTVCDKLAWLREAISTGLGILLCISRWKVFVRAGTEPVI